MTHTFMLTVQKVKVRKKNDRKIIKIFTDGKLNSLKLS